MLFNVLTPHFIEILFPYFHKTTLGPLRSTDQFTKKQIDSFLQNPIHFLKILNQLPSKKAKKIAAWYQTTHAWEKLKKDQKNRSLLTAEMIICFVLLTEEKITLKPDVLMAAIKKYTQQRPLSSLILRNLHILIAASAENDTSCDLLSMPSPPTEESLDLITLKSNAAYIRSGEQLFYVHKIYKECQKIETNQKNLDFIDKVMSQLGKNNVTLDKNNLYYINHRLQHAHKNKDSQLAPLLMQTKNPALNINLAGTDLKKINLYELLPKKKRISLIKANLNQVNFTFAMLKNVNFSGANLKNANLTYANLSDANFTEADLSDANLTNANLSRTCFLKANLSNTQFLNIFNGLISSLDHFEIFFKSIHALKFSEKIIFLNAIAKDVVRQLKDSDCNMHQKIRILTITKHHPLFQSTYVLAFASHFVSPKMTSTEIFRNYRRSIKEELAPSKKPCIR